jgi:phosphoglycerate dehydrogenase-like enzyme
MDNVTVTTHSANTVSSMDRQLAKPVVENYRAFLAGERMPTELDVGAAY